MSAQLASLYCIACEHWKLKHSPPKLVFGSTIRFRDNILLIKLNDTSTTELLLLCKTIYQLDFTKEQAGEFLESLEIRLKWVKDDVENFLRFDLSWKQGGIMQAPRPEMQLKKWLSPHSLNVRFMLRCYLPSALSKCLFYASDDSIKTHNVRLLMKQLEEVYPRAWWWKNCRYTLLQIKKGIG